MKRILPYRPLNTFGNSTIRKLPARLCSRPASRIVTTSRDFVSLHAQKQNPWEPINHQLILIIDSLISRSRSMVMVMVIVNELNNLLAQLV